jgi:hypothetical protein
MDVNRLSLINCLTSVLEASSVKVQTTSVNIRTIHNQLEVLFTTKERPWYNALGDQPDKPEHLRKAIISGASFDH